MRLSETTPFQLGSDFSPGLNVDIARRWPKLQSRTDYVLSRCVGKSVLHIGCADHVPLIEEKRSAGTWLHARIDQVAKRCVGIDINADGIKAMNRLGYEAYAVNIGEQKLDIIDSKFDVAVLAETIEHIDDATGFLRAARINLSGLTERIIITTPNAFRQDNFRFAMRNIENTNTDHRIWFTPYTLCKAITRAGFGVTDLTFTYGSAPPHSFLKRSFYRAFPMLAMGLGVTADIQPLVAV